MRWRKPAVAVAVMLMLVGSGCGSGEGSTDGGMGPAHMESQMGQRAQARRMRHRAMMRHRQAMRERHRAMMRQRRRLRMMARHRAALRQLRSEEAEAEEPAPEESSECDPNYAGACLDPHASDYDCADGSGNGPDYTGTVRVVGEDHYGLDADGDGVGCESE